MNTTKLKFTRHHYEQLRGHLLQADGNERFAYLYCVPSGPNWVVNEHRLLEDEQMNTITGTSCRPDMDVEFQYLQECRQRGKVPVLLHSHPFADVAWFSAMDYRLMSYYRDWITGLYDDWNMGFAVMAQEQLCATQIDAATGGFTELHPVVIGEQHPPNPVPTEYVDDIDTERYDRSIRAHGTATQQRITQMHVIIAGVGGVGSAAAEQLARLGVGKITLVDPDVIEASNLPRLIGAAPHHEGKPKVDAVKEAVYRANPDTAVETVTGYLEEHEDVATTADLILQCVDRDVSRSSLSQLAVKHLIPVIDAGIRIIRGNDEEPGTRAVFVFTTIPGDTACFTCLGRGDPDTMRLEAMSSDEIQIRKEQGYLDEDDVAPKASLVTATMMAASMACSAFMEYVATGAMTDMYRYDMVTGDGMQVNAPVSDDCPVCTGGLLARGDHEATKEELRELVGDSFAEIALVDPLEPVAE